MAGGLAASAGGRFFGWVIGGAVPAALAADWLTSAWDQNAGMYAVAPAAAVVEEVCGRWLLELLGLPRTASFALVTGCQMAHVTCLAAARNAVLARHGWDVEQQGLVGAPAIRVVTGDQRHGTIERALRLLGLGQRSIVDIPVDENGLTGAALEPVLAAAPDAPTIVLLQAGDLNTGAFDPFPEVIPVAHGYGAWVHVDGAFGLWAATSPDHQRLTAGVEQADSWATDGHKWLNVPYDCGYAIVADREAHRRSFSHRVAYLDHSDVARDQVDWNPEYSRRARGFATYAAIASLGREGIGRIVAECCRHARAIVEGAGALPGVQVAVPAADQPGPAALPRSSARGDRGGSRPAHGRGHRQDRRVGRGALRVHHLARPALHAGVGLRLGDHGRRRRAHRAGDRRRDPDAGGRDRPACGAARVIVALASPRAARTLDEGLAKVERFVAEASGRGADVVCFPEAYLPGLRGQEFAVPPFDRAQQERALDAVAHWARRHDIAVILEGRAMSRRDH